MNDYPDVKVEHLTLDRIPQENLKGLNTQEREALEEYFKGFAIFNDDATKCRCGRTLGFPGTIMNVMGIDTFTWGIVNGEGYCYNCEWPGRALHRLENMDIHFEAVLMYHPDFVVSQKDLAKEEIS